MLFLSLFTPFSTLCYSSWGCAEVPASQWVWKRSSLFNERKLSYQGACCTCVEWRHFQLGRSNFPLLGSVGDLQSHALPWPLPGNVLKKSWRVFLAEWIPQAPTYKVILKDDYDNVNSTVMAIFLVWSFFLTQHNAHDTSAKKVYVMQY